MAGIEKFLIENPEFKDEDPSEVANFVYETQMNGVDRAEFDEYFIGKTDERGLFGKAYDKVSGMIQGDAEFPDAQSVSGTSSKAAFAGIMGDDQDWAKAIQEERPGSEIFTDKNENVMIRNPDGSEEYVNTPGLDKKDIARFAGKMLSFVPAGKATTMAAGAGMTARVGAAALTAGGTDAAMQKLAGRDEVDKQQAALTAILGAGAEGVAVPVGSALKWAKSKIGNRWGRLSDQRKGQLIAKKMGLHDLNESQHIRLAKIDNLDMSKQAKMADAEFGIQQTRGQVMPKATDKQRIARDRQLSREEMMIQTPEGQVLKNIKENNQGKIREGVDQVADTFSGGTRQGGSRNESAEVVQRELIAVKESMEKAFKSTYDDAASREVNYMDAAVKKIPEYMRKKISANDDLLLTDTGTPQALKALDRIEEYVGKLNVSSDPKQFTVGLKHMERLRKDMNLLMGQTSKLDGGEDRRALHVIQKELMGVVERMGDASLFKGDPKAIKLQKEANKMFADYAGKFRSRNTAGKVIQKIVDEDASPDQVARYLFGTSGLGKMEALQAVRAYKKIVGKDSDAYNALKETFFYANASNKQAEAKGAQGMVSSIKNLLNNDGAGLVKELYKPEEVAKMRRFVVAVEQTLPEANRRATSGSIERLTRMLSAGIDQSPIGFLSEIIKGPWNKHQAKYMVDIPKIKGSAQMSVLPASGALATQ